jgi:hypothetical protein
VTGRPHHAKLPNDPVQQRGRLDGLDTSENQNAGPVCCNWLFGETCACPIGYPVSFSA